MLSLMKPDPQWAVCLEHCVLVFCPDAFIFLGTAAPLASVKNGSGSRLLKFTAEFIEAMPFLKTHGKNFIEVWRPGATEFLLRIKIFFFPQAFYFFKSGFMFVGILRGGYRDFPFTSMLPRQEWPPLLQTPPIRGVHLLASGNYTDMSESPRVHSLHQGSFLVLRVL